MLTEITVLQSTFFSPCSGCVPAGLHLHGLQSGKP